MLKHMFIARPDDWHAHFRDNELLGYTVPGSAKHFARALAMPNLDPPLTTIDSLLGYRSRLLASVDDDVFEPYLTFYLNESVSLNELVRAKQHPFILGGKCYPVGATTHAAAGVTAIQNLYPHFEVMQDQDLVLQIHGEINAGDIFDRESAFIQTHLTPLVRNFPRLRIVLEHISTRAAVDFILQSSEQVAATITPHHLLFNRNQLLAGGIRPHFYCLPILKRETDQIALQQAALSGNPRFFAGTDSAPHAQAQKESACGCAGVYSAPYALAMYAQVFEAGGKLNRLEAFTSRFGAEFYQLKLNTLQIELIRKPQVIPEFLPFGAGSVVPLAAGSTLSWSIRDAYTDV